jgi:hypothetical protein
VHFQWRHSFFGNRYALAVLAALSAFIEQCFKTVEELFVHPVAIRLLRMLQLL